MSAAAEGMAVVAAAQSAQARADVPSAPVIADPAAPAARLWIPELDGYRAIAALTVIMHHTASSVWESVALANTGVALFFCLSGFLLYVLASTEFERTGGLRLRNFFMRRILRIWPLYFVSLILSLLLFGGPPVYDHPHFRALTNLTTLEYLRLYAWAFPVFLVSWAMAFNFVGGWYWWSPDIFSITWSISVEEQFYLLFPFVFLLVARRTVPGGALVVALLVGALLARYWHISLPVNHPEPAKIGSSSGLYYAGYSYIDMFLLGAVAAWIYRRRLGQESARAMTVLAVVAALGTYGLMVWWAPSIWLPYTWYSPTIYSGLAVSLSALIYAGVAAPASPLAIALRWYPLRIVGLLSYAMYLTHLGALRFTAWWLDGVPSLVPNGHPLYAHLFTFHTIVTTVLVACILHVLVERPFLRLKRRQGGVSARAEVPLLWTFGVTIGIMLLLDTIVWRVFF